MITLGVILLIVGFLIKIPILWTIGIIVLIVGLVCWRWAPWAAPSAAASTSTKRSPAPWQSR